MLDLAHVLAFIVNCFSMVGDVSVNNEMSVVTS